MVGQYRIGDGTIHVPALGVFSSTALGNYHPCALVAVLLERATIYVNGCSRARRRRCFGSCLKAAAC
jgi:hypothetical protein